MIIDQRGYRSYLEAMEMPWPVCHDSLYPIHAFRGLAYPEGRGRYFDWRVERDAMSWLGAPTPAG